jgi:hypothetical protein
MTEKDIQNRIRVALSEHGVVLRLNVGTFQTQDGRIIASGLPPGCPDLLFIGNGYIAFIEVKTLKGRVSPEQKRFIDRVRKLGHKAGIARSVEEALNIIGG